MAKQVFADIALETKCFRQSKARCGPAALKIVARYFGVNVSEPQLAKVCRSSVVSGTTGKNLVAAAQKLGFAAQIIDGATFRIIATWLSRNVPVIVDWMSIAHRGDVRVSTEHYSVVSGLTATEIILEDPAIGRKRRLSREFFMSLWYDFKYLSPRKNKHLVWRRMIVVAPPNLPGGQRVGAVGRPLKSSVMAKQAPRIRPRRARQP